MERNKAIIRTSVVGIAANVLLAGFKALVGWVSGSVAVVMDAVNNLSDALSSVITIVGTKLSAKNPDRKHPFGHGRVEYLSAIVIAIIVLIAGVTSLIQSVGKIIHPSKVEYTTVTLMIIVVAIVVKLLLGLYVKAKGKKLESDALKASGADALFDAIITASTLVSAGIMLIWGVNLDGYFGSAISLFIIKAGIDMLDSPVSQLLGTSIPRELYQNIKHDVMEHHPEVHGVNDIILNYYGPQTIIGSLNISVPDTTTAREIHGLTRMIAAEIGMRYGIILTVGIYACHTGELKQLEQEVKKAAKAIPHVMYVHAFYLFQEQGVITLDVIPDDEIHDDAAFRQVVAAALKQQFPSYTFQLAIDHNYTE